MTYQDALDYLYGFINRGVQRYQRYTYPDLNLDRPHQLMALRGHPQNAYPVLHLTGTKGKGSVGAMSAAILQAAGLRVGLFSSPHLQDFRERIKINQALIPQQRLIEVVQDIQPAVEEVHPLSWFEVVTLLAFEYFRQESVDIAVIEVGMGGRLDATNVVSPLASIITSISYDHTSLLGNTLAEIATEKSGIIKPHIPVISAPQTPEAMDVIERVAQANRAPLTVVGRDWEFVAQGGDLYREYWQAAPAGHPLDAYETVLLGRHQAMNATVAMAAMDAIRQRGLDIPQQAIHHGLQQVNWSGRLEIIKQRPMVILDAAHNGDSARWLAQTLQERFLSERQALTLVFAAKADKDIVGMLQALLPLTQHLMITLAVDSRAESPEAIAEIARQIGFTGQLTILPQVSEAVQQAEVLASDDGLVCVTGSLFLVGEVRTLYGLPIGQAMYPKRVNQP